MKRTIERFGVLVAMLCSSSAGAQAQPLYKSTMPDGSVIYSEKPVAGARRVETLAPPPASTGVELVKPEERERLEQRLKERAAESAKRERAIAAARRELERAQAALAAGKEPLPGERIGIAGGGTRLSEEYWERQKKLESAVEAARRKLDEAMR
jgi:hypothetical protein